MTADALSSLDRCPVCDRPPTEHCPLWARSVAWCLVAPLLAVWVGFLVWCAVLVWGAL